MMADGAGRVNAVVELPGNGGPKELQVKLRLPKKNLLKTVSVNGVPAEISGLHNDSVLIATGKQTRFEIVGEFV
jgi:hypothetical protein